MQSNEQLSMSMFASKADYEAAGAELERSNQEKVIFDIKADPSLILQLKDGDQVSVDGILLDVLSITHKQWIYLRTVDSKTDEYHNRIDEDNLDVHTEYRDYIKHLRKNEEGRIYGKACMAREEFKLLLESGNYYIG